MYTEAGLCDTLKLGDAYMRRRIGPSLIEVMACRLLFGTKPLSEPMLTYTFRNKLQRNLNQNWNRLSLKCTCECRLPSGVHLGQASLCLLIMAKCCHMVSAILVNTGSGNDLLADGTKPFPGPMLTDYHRGVVAFTWGQFHFLVYGLHYSDAIMTVMVSQITSVSIVYSTVCSGTYQRKHQSFALLAFVRGIHRSPVNSPHVTRKMFPSDDVIISPFVFRWCIFASHLVGID